MTAVSPAYEGGHVAVAVGAPLLLSSDRSSTIGMTRCRYAVRYV